MKILKAFVIGYFIGKNYFDEDGAENWLVFQPIGKYLKTTHKNNIIYIESWESKGVSNYNINSIYTNNYLLSRSVDYYLTSKVRIKFDGSFLHAISPSINHGKIVNIYLFDEITKFHGIDDYPTVTNALCGSVKLTKNNDIDKYKYSGYGIRFDGRGYYSIGNELGRNVMIFEVNTDSSKFSSNRRKNI